MPEPTFADGAIQFRAACLADASALFAMRRKAILELSLSHLSSSEASAWAERGGLERVQRGIIDEEIWVALRGSNPVGWVRLWENTIQGLYVDPMVAHQGVGKALLNFAEAIISVAGHRTVGLVASRNAVGFYSRFGYLPDSRSVEDGGVPMAKVMMTTQSMP